MKLILIITISIRKGGTKLKNPVLIGSFFCFIAAVSWGAMFPVAHSAFQYIDPFYFTIFRYGAVSIILAGILFWKEGKEAFRFEGKGRRLWFFGTMAFTVYNLFIFWGEDLLGHHGVLVASIMESLMPMISIVIYWTFFKKPPFPFTLACVLFSFAGAVLVITEGKIDAFFSAAGNVIPTLLILIAVVGWVIYTMGGSEFQGWSALRYSTISCLLGTFTALIITLVATVFGYLDVPSKSGLIAAAPHLLFMIVFPGIIALIGWNAGVSLLSPVNGLLFINFVPITTLFISFLQGRQHTVFDAIGTVLIITALISNNLFIRFMEKRMPDMAEEQLQDGPVCIETTD